MSKRPALWARALRRAKREMQKPFRRVLRSFHALPTIELAEIARDEVQLEPLILDDICLPPHHDPPDHDDATPVLKIARSRQPRVILEFGTAYGNLTANLCRQCPQARVYTVNAPVEEQTGVLTSFDLTKEQIGRVYRAHGFAPRVVQIYADTMRMDLSPHFPKPVVELAIIDACHDTEYVINDFRKVQPFVIPGGLVLFHDTFPSLYTSHLDGSYRACLELRRQGHDIRHLKNTWWGVWIQPGELR